jgi:chromosome partitioning protein
VALGRTGEKAMPADAASTSSFAPVPQQPTLPAPTLPTGPAVENSFGDSGGVAVSTPVAATPRASVLKLVETPRPPVSPTTHRLFGVRETNQGVLFVQPLTLGDQVSIAASFNNWTPSDHVMRANHELGIWELCVKLPAGKHTYRLVIDGQWCTDPSNNTCEPNPFGETNSAFTVTGTPSL